MAPDRRAPTLNVAIVEDQPNIREGLRILIDGTTGYRCTGAYSTIEKALPQFEREAPDVALVDIGLPGVSGIEGARIVRERFPAVQVIILTVYDDDERIFQALCAGAFGYLLKNTPPARLIESIREVANGGAPVSPEIARRVITLFQRVHRPQTAEQDLTPHELRILKLLVEGHNYKSAGALLGVTVNTISFHVRRIYEKLQVHSKSEAVAKALRSNLVG
jgi:DNA-binding NarL/FixJ family response regulator